MTVRFEEALRNALGVVQPAMDLALAEVGQVVLVRDLVGRIHLVVERAPNSSNALAPILDALRAACGRFHVDSVLSGDSMVVPQAILESSDAQRITKRLSLLERVATGADWGRGLLSDQAPRPPRATLYGIKGGVGRSTTLCVWARHLAEAGEKVLVIDLDLEAPGVSSMLVPSDVHAEFGLVDWLVEDAVGNADDGLVRLMTVDSPLGAGTSGSIVVAPCRGCPNDDYLAKLARSYINVAGATGTRTFADRIGQLVDRLERIVEPTVVLIDSRSGIHDIAATATTRLGAVTFLFAIDSRQTWDAYEILLSGWGRRPKIAVELRERLQVVAAQVPETNRRQYLDSAQQHAYDIFQRSLYEETPLNGNDTFNFDVTAAEAPHYPLPVYWSRAIQEWDPAEGAVPPEQVDALCGKFLARATELVFASRE